MSFLIKFSFLHPKNLQGTLWVSQGLTQHNHLSVVQSISIQVETLQDFTAGESIIEILAIDTS